MKKTKISANIWMLSPSSGHACNSYLIESAGKKILIDSGDGSHDFGFTPDLCILTHGHWDHTRGVKPEWGSVLAHPAEIKFCSNLPSGLADLFYMPQQAKPLEPGKHVFFGFELEIFHTPGHTPGSICILDKKSGILFSGDTVFAGGYFGRTDIGGSEGEIYKSLQKIRAMDYALLASGHGQVESRGKHHSNKGM